METPKNTPKLSLVERIALKHNSSVRYVNYIKEGKRTPTRGKGLLIAQDLEALEAAQEAALQS